jgi:hypothetical protein
MTSTRTCALLLAASLCACAKPGATTDAALPLSGGLHSPEGVAASARYILVASSGFSYAGGKPSYEPGSVHLFERATRAPVVRIPTSALNPQAIAVHAERAYVVSSGRVALDAASLATAESDGALDVIDLAASPPARIASLPLPRSAADPRIGNYGGIALSPDGKLAFLGSGTRGDLFVVELEPLRLRRGPEQPLALFPTPAGENRLTTPRMRGGELLALSFESDELCASDDLAGELARRRCGSVGVNAALLEGALDLAPLDDGGVLVLMSIANALHRVDPARTPFGLDAGFARTGLGANRVRVHGGHAYVVNSISNNLQRVDLKSRESREPFAIFPVLSNPYDLVITEEAEGPIAWVSLFGSHELAVVSLATGEVLARLSGAGTPASDAGAARPDAGVPDRPRPCPDGGGPLVGIGAVVSLSLGEGGGLNQEKLPAVIQGGPSGGGAGGSTDVLSLGVGGELVVDFGDHEIVDGPGPDFVVFENPFLVGPYAPFAEPARVGLSESDPTSFLEIPCDLQATRGDPAKATWPYPGCAGVRPVTFGPGSCLPLDPATSGGDAFDLASVGLKRARYLRLRDAGVSTSGATGSKGFDLDAVVLIHYEKR